jgi:gas vesicle protein
MTKKDGSSKFFVVAALGAIAGAVAGVLFAPKRGKETRKIIGDKSREYVDKGKEMVEKGGDLAKEKISQAAKEVSQKMDK